MTCSHYEQVFLYDLLYYRARGMNMGEKGYSELNNSEKLEISGFMRQLSTEIRNPVSTILGNAEFISREEINDRVRDKLTDIKKAADKLRILTEDMVDIVRISNGEIQLADEEYCFEDLILELRSGIEHDANARGLKCNIDIDGAIPYRMFGDRNRLKQILTRLVTNAFDFARSEVIFSAKCLPASDGRTFLKFDAVDDGRGILFEDTIRILCGKGASFEQGMEGLDPSTVGYFIAKYFAGRMGGKLTVKARQGESCTFTILVNQGTVGLATLNDHHEAEGAHQEEHIPFTAHDVRALIVRGDRESARNYQRLLGRYMVSADFTDDTEEALKLIDRIRYDLVFTDAVMPGKDTDGYKLAAAIRAGNVDTDSEKRAYYTSIPVIGLSTQDAVEVTGDINLSGMNECLRTPSDIATLERVLREYLPADKLSFTKEFSYEGRGLEVLEELGLNTADALANFQGDEDEYKNVLLTMCRSSDTKGKLLKHYVEQHDYKNYIVTVHGILGVAQMIGADMLASKSRELEQAAKQGMLEMIESETAGFADSFDKLLSSVRNAIMTEDTVVSKGAIDREDLLAIIDELKGYLAEYQLNEVEELFFTLAQFSYPNNRVMELIHQAEEQMLSYNYNEVATLLDGIKGELDA